MLLGRCSLCNAPNSVTTDYLMETTKFRLKFYCANENNRVDSQGNCLFPTVHVSFYCPKSLYTVDILSGEFIERFHILHRNDTDKWKFPFNHLRFDLQQFAENLRLTRLRLNRVKRTFEIPRSRVSRVLVVSISRIDHANLCHTSLFGTPYNQFLSRNLCKWFFRTNIPARSISSQFVASG